MISTSAFTFIAAVLCLAGSARADWWIYNTSPLITYASPNGTAAWNASEMLFTTNVDGATASVDLTGWEVAVLGPSVKGKGWRLHVDGIDITSKLRTGGPDEWYYDQLENGLHHVQLEVVASELNETSLSFDGFKTSLWGGYKTVKSYERYVSDRGERWWFNTTGDWRNTTGPRVTNASAAPGIVTNETGSTVTFELHPRTINFKLESRAELGRGPYAVTVSPAPPHGQPERLEMNPSTAESGPNATLISPLYHGGDPATVYNVVLDDTKRYVVKVEYLGDETQLLALDAVLWRTKNHVGLGWIGVPAAVFGPILIIIVLKVLHSLVTTCVSKCKSRKRRSQAQGEDLEMGNATGSSTRVGSADNGRSPNSDSAAASTVNGAASTLVPESVSTKVDDETSVKSVPSTKHSEPQGYDV